MDSKRWARVSSAWMQVGSKVRVRLQSAIESAVRPAARKAEERWRKHWARKVCGTGRRPSRIFVKRRMASEGRPASRAAMAAVRRRRRSFTWLRRAAVVSDSTVVVGTIGKLLSEKPSSDRLVLSRREAAVARRFPV